MFARAIVIGAIVSSAFLIQPVRAGLYNTTDAVYETQLNQDFRKIFSGVLGDLRTISVEKPEREPPLRKRYMLMESLGRRGALELKTLEQQLDYSAVLIRRGKAVEAIPFLEPITQAHPKNFLVFSHFATAHYLSGNPDFRSRAADYMKQALEIWPTHWEDLEQEQKQFVEKLGWEQGLYDQNRKYEVYFEKLLRSRNREEARRKNKLAVPDGLDPLFTDANKKPVRFVNQDGKYEAGRIATIEKEKLPGDAIEIVEQLLVWMPNDIRLYWQLAELYNARATDQKAPADKNQSIQTAVQIMKELVTGLRAAGAEASVPDELLEHFAKLKDHVERMPSAPMPKELAEIVNKPDTDDEETSRRWWRALIVGFITGFAVGLFALWQFQEMRRRRQARASSDR